MTSFEGLVTPQLGNRTVWLRPDTSDRQVWSDTFVGLYHVPPDSMPEPRTVLDLGANIGLTAAHYSEIWPLAQVVAVEMDEACVELGRRNAPDATWYREAVSAAPGVGSYVSTVRAEAYRFEPGLILHGGSEIPRQLVEARTLRQIILRSFPESGLPHHPAPSGVDFVKMDVEGSEWGILKRAEGWAGLVRHLLVELHPDDDHRDDNAVLVDAALYLLRAAGFQAEPFTRHPRAVWAWQP